VVARLSAAACTMPLYQARPVSCQGRGASAGMPGVVTGGVVGVGARAGHPYQPSAAAPGTGRSGVHCVRVSAASAVQGIERPAPVGAPGSKFGSVQPIAAGQSHQR